MNEQISKLLIRNNLTIKEAMKQMDSAGEKILFVVDERAVLCGSMTDGDIRRWILKEGSLQESISKVLNRNPRSVKRGCGTAQTKEIMLRHKIEALPVVDDNNVLIDVLFWDHLFADEAKPAREAIRIPVLVMAGGKGTRLDPFTKILPKPLIPIGDKPIIEHIMDQFSEFGCNDFYLTLNYKGKMIQSYFDHAECAYNIKFIWEDTFLGTAGGLKLAGPLIDAPHLFVSNCDILIRADYRDIYHHHITHQNDVTVVGSMQHLSVPFGVVEMKNGGSLEKIIEKPEFDFLANTGMYLVKSDVIDLLAADTKTDFPELLARVREAGRKVGVYPVSQQSWIDIGQWQEYHAALNKLEQKN